MIKYLITAFLACVFVSVLGQNPKLYFYEDFNHEKWSHTIGDSNLCIEEELPDGWQVYDSLGHDYFWHWSDVGPRGHYINESEPLKPNNLLLDDEYWKMENSIDNGFMMLESDFFNTDSLGHLRAYSEPLSSYIQYGPVDLSQAAYPLIEFNSHLRVCCNPAKGKMQLLVSTNYDKDNPENATWVPYNLDFLHSNYYSAKVMFNISDQAAGESEVYFRWKQMNLSHYYWMLDDIKVYEALSNEVAILDYWADYHEVIDEDNLVGKPTNWVNGGYTKIPVYTTSSFKEIRAAVKNNGSQTQDVDLNSALIKDGIELASEKSSKTSIEFLETDTIKLSVNFELDGLGSYQISNTVQSQYHDEDETNNEVAYNFEVTENEYSHVYASNAANFITGGKWSFFPGGIEGIEIYTQKFEFFGNLNQVFFKQMKFYLPSFKGSVSEQRALQNGIISVVGRVFKPSSDDNNLPMLPAIISSNEYELSLADTSSWISLDFNDEGDLFVNEGSYFVGVEVYVGPSESAVQFGIGVDNSGPKQLYGGGQMYDSGNGRWSYSGENYAIELITDAKTVAINSTNSQTLFYPNPVKDKLVVNDLDKIKRLKLYSIDGQLMTVWDKALPQLSMADYKSGIYIL